MSTKPAESSIIKCVVCSETCTEPLNFCPACKSACHSRCAGKKLNYACNLCRKIKQTTDNRTGLVGKSSAIPAGSSTPSAKLKTKVLERKGSSQVYSAAEDSVSPAAEHQAPSPYANITAVPPVLSATTTSAKERQMKQTSHSHNQTGPSIKPSSATKKMTGKQQRKQPDTTPFSLPRRIPVGSSTPAAKLKTKTLKRKESSHVYSAAEDSVSLVAEHQAPSPYGPHGNITAILPVSPVTTALVKEDKVGEEEKEDISHSMKVPTNTTSDEQKKKKGAHYSDDVPSLVPRSRHSVLVPTPSRPVAGMPSPPRSNISATVNTPFSLSASVVNRSSSDHPNELNYSTLKNGSIISSLVTYANSVRDTVGSAINSQQGSIASKLEEIANSLNVLPSLTQTIGSLVSKVDSLEALLVERTTQLHATTKECELLREQVGKQCNSIDAKFLKLENAFSKLMSVSSQPPVDINVCNVASSRPKRKIKNLVSKPRTKNDSSLHHTLASSSTDINIDKDNNFAETTDVNNREIVLTNIMNDCDFDHKRSALAILRTVLPTVTAEDIVSCRLAGRREKGSSDITSYTRPPPIFVKMRSSSLVRNVIAAKKRVNLLHTSDLEPSSLRELESSKLITTNIYINEALEAHSFRHFLNLKFVAKRLGFKYIWHRKGSFLAKWNDGKRSHVFTSATDLETIAETYKLSSKSPNRSKAD